YAPTLQRPWPQPLDIGHNPVTEGVNHVRSSALLVNQGWTTLPAGATLRGGRRYGCFHLHTALVVPRHMPPDTMACGSMECLGPWQYAPSAPRWPASRAAARAR